MKRRRIQMILAFKKGNIRTKKKSTIRKENYQKEEISLIWKNSRGDNKQELRETNKNNKELMTVKKSLIHKKILFKMLMEVMN